MRNFCYRALRAVSCSLRLRTGCTDISGPGPIVASWRCALFHLQNRSWPIAPRCAVLLAASALIAGAACQAPAARSVSAGEPLREPEPTSTEPRSSGEQVVVLWVEGMSCPLCVTNIEKQLMHVKGVRRVSLDLGSGRVEVRVSAGNPPDRDQLARAVHQAGFTLARIDDGPAPQSRQGDAP